MFKNILIVCVGNICRSPTAEALFAHRLSGQDLTISSAGIGALVGNPMDKTAHEVLQDNGLELPAHCARQVDSRSNTMIGAYGSMLKRVTLPSTTSAARRSVLVVSCHR